MYTSFHVERFRCFDHLEVSDLARVNLIAGMNNVGKTALLEALFLHCGAHNPSLIMNINASRGLRSHEVRGGGRSEMPWDSLFPGFDTSRVITLRGDGQAQARRVVRLKALRGGGAGTDAVLVGAGQSRGVVTREGGPDEGRTAEGVPYHVGDPGAALSSQFPTWLEVEDEGELGSGRHVLSFGLDGMGISPRPGIAPFAGWFVGSGPRSPTAEDPGLFSALARAGRERLVTEALRTLEPRLQNVEVHDLGGEMILHGRVEGAGLLPLPLMGNGMVRLTNLVLRLAHGEDGVVMMDEIENGLHHSVLQDVWRVVGAAAREFNCQVFATTHSLECVEAAHTAFKDGEDDDFRLHRLQRVGDEIEAVTYDQKRLDVAEEMEFEVR